jgi:tetrahydromethanopterin S-methyltransferase subunit G
MVGFIANQTTRIILEKNGVDKKTAKWIGRGVGILTGAVIGDLSGFIPYNPGS